MIQFHALPAAALAAIRAGGTDAYGNPPEVAISDGDGVPCRAMMTMVPAGAPYLILAHRPFEGLHPYTETGPIFVAEGAERTPPTTDLPEMLSSPRYILRGYGADERIVYGTGRVIETPDIPAYAETLLARDDIAFVHVRSASNNCYQCRIERAPDDAV
ncbi:MAG: DUF1203 domain-containing protein [Shimia sp.]